MQLIAKYHAGEKAYSADAIDDLTATKLITK